jgi:hypothetical protein
MKCLLKNSARLPFLVALVVSGSAWCALAFAQEEASVLVERQGGPTLEAPQLADPEDMAAIVPLLPPPNRAAEAAPQQSRPEVKRPFLRPAEPRRRVPATTALSVTEEPIPAPDPGMIVESPEFEVRPAPPIEYDTDGDARRMYRKTGEVHVVMIAKNPADGCHYEIPMCIPGCCVGEPRVTGGRGLLGRGVVEFCWECGFRAEVKFRHILGDVKVEYEGD